MERPNLGKRISRAVDCFAPGASLHSIEALKGGVSATMARIEILLPDGSLHKYVVRTPGKWTADEPPGFIEREYKILQQVYKTGILSPNPVYLEEPGSEDRFYILEYIEGAPELKPSDPVAYGRDFAELHAQIHGLDLQSHGLQDTRYLPTEIRKLGDAFDPRTREEEVRNALDKLGPSEDVNPPVFRHGDLWPGNVLWLDGQVSGIVDWENASLGEPLFDLSITRLDLLWVAGWEATDAFTEHYVKLRQIDVAQLPKFDLVTALRLSSALDMIAPAYPPLGRPDVTAETLVRDLAEFVDSALSRI
jgi:prepilin-type processing-associated H-X9-DG protein